MRQCCALERAARICSDGNRDRVGRANSPPVPAGALLRITSSTPLVAEPATSVVQRIALPAGATVAATGRAASAGGWAWYEVAIRSVTGWVVLQPDGSNLARVTNGDIAFGCTGCSETNGRGLAEVHPDGTGSRVLYPGFGTPFWSPDGSWLVSIVEGTDGLGPLRPLMQSAAGAEARLLQPGSAPAWSPDGSAFAYVTEDGRITVAGPDLKTTTYSVLDQGVRGPLAWSPDGKTLAFVGINCPTCTPGQPFADDPPLAVFMFDPPGGDVRSLGAVARGGRLRELAWQPDGSGVVVIEQAANAEAISIRELDRSGRSTVLVADIGFGWEHRISPDGRQRLAATPRGIVLSNLADTGGRVVVPATASSNPTPRAPRWSPDGQWILYDLTAVTGDAAETWMVRVDGSDAHRLRLDSSFASWQPVLAPLE